MKENKINTKYMFSFASFSKIKKIELRKLQLRKKNYEIFFENGKFAINKKEINCINYLNQLSRNKKRWKNYPYKKQYLRRNRYKKQKRRIINYIKKNITNQTGLNYIKVKKTIVKNSKIIYEKEVNKYKITKFEYINIKIRIIENCLKSI